ncbi:MAG: transpeptidase family protein [Acidobacteria bacterium]|nr:transpeptidase family protein [Acidobacteriota bacterium]
MPERSHARAQVRPDNSRQRTTFVVVFVGVWMLAVGVRLVQLQVFQHEFLSARARRQQQSATETNGARGLILDRQGKELARSLDVDSFFAEPVHVTDARSVAAAFAPLLGVGADQLQAKLEQEIAAKRKFIWLAREVEPEQAEPIKAVVESLKLAGVGSVKEQKRYYPNGSLAAHVLGFVGLDDAGLAGVESFQNASLKGEDGETVVARDAKRRGFESREIAPKQGGSVVLTIDQNVQYVVERELAAAFEQTHAKSGAALALDPRTGEILALANAPTFDPNASKSIAPELLTNRALQYTYEPGSTFKVVAYSGAIEERLVKPTDLIDCQMGSINVFGRIVHDSHPHGTLTVTEALAQSSNVAAIKIGMKLGDERLYDYVRRFGFGAKTGVELPGETRGLLRDVKKWDKTSIGSIPMGQEIGVTPVQVAAAFGTIANGGVRIAPHVVREVRDESGRVVAQPAPETHRVVGAETARTIATMLEQVTVDGTAKAAKLDGYTVAGKTGTAQKYERGTHSYSKSKYVASFVGFAPVEDPRIVIIVVLDEPVGSYYGGAVAAPVFKRIAEQVLPYLGVAPSDDLREKPANNTDQIAALDHAAKMYAGGASPDGSAGASQAGGARSNGSKSEGEVAPASLPLVVEGVRGRGEIKEVVYAAAADHALVMPDVRGRSVRDAARICAALGLELEARGEGRAVAQSPAAGAAVEAGQKVRVEFSRRD